MEVGTVFITSSITKPNSFRPQPLTPLEIVTSLLIYYLEHFHLGWKEFYILSYSRNSERGGFCSQLSIIPVLKSVGHKRIKAPPLPPIPPWTFCYEQLNHHGFRAHYKSWFIIFLFIFRLISLDVMWWLEAGGEKIVVKLSRQWQVCGPSELG